MNTYTTYNHYIDRYGEVEGKQLFLQYCDFMIECLPFPENLDWCEIQREILNDEI